MSKNHWIDEKEKKQEIIDYVFLMLGVPVIKVELDESQVELAIDTAKKK